MNIENQIKRLYAFDLSICFRIADAVWVIFLLQRGFSLAQVGLAEGIYHITSMICEVPSGMAADLFGRRRSLMLAGLLGMISGMFMGFSQGFFGICAGMMFSALSLNMMSGTEEALAYDSLLACGQEERFGEVWARISMIGRTGGALACLASSVAIALGYRITYLFVVGLSFLTILCAFSLTEPLVTEQQLARQERPFQGVGGRLAEHIRISIRFVKEHPRTICKLLANAAVACPVYLTMMFLQEHLPSRGWPAAWIGIPLLSMRMMGAAGVWLGSRRALKKDRAHALRKTMLVCGVLGGLGACLAGSGSVITILLGAWLLQACEGFASIRVEEQVNREFESDQRATMISIDSMLYSLLMIGVSPTVGKLGDLWGTSVGFTAMGAALIVGTCVFGIWYDTMIKKLLVRRNQGML